MKNKILKVNPTIKMPMKKIFTILILLSVVTSSYSQKKYTISGYITDKTNGESVVGVNIYCPALNLGVT